MKRLFGTLAVSAMLIGSVQANPFTDVPSGHWAYNAINHVVQAGVMKGYRGGMFKGKETVSRYEMAIIISRLLNKMKGHEVSTDVRRTMDRLGEEFMDELDLIGARLTALENAFHEHVTDGGDMGSGTGVNISGEVRVRTELWDMDMAAATDVSDDVTWHRTRINMEKAVGDADVYAQLQHSGSFGNGANMNGTLDDDDLSLHQVYSNIHFGEDGNTRDLQVGRFEMAYGDETLIGSVNWSNVGRTFDGFRYTSREAGDDFGWDLFYTNLTDDNPRSPMGADGVAGLNPVTGLNDDPSANDDQFMGLNLTWDEVLDGGLNVFYYKRNADNVAAGNRLNTLGFNWNRRDDDWNYYLQYAQQSGDTAANAVPEYDGNMMRATVSYDYDEDKSVALDYHSYSGDDAGPDNGAWQRLYDTGHGILGLADTFTQGQAFKAAATVGAGTQTGIDDLSIHFKWNQDDTSSWGLAYHMFTANEVAANTDDDLGSEIDLTYSYQYSDDVSFDFGYATYSEGGDQDVGSATAQGISPRDRDFMWVTTNVNF